MFVLVESVEGPLSGRERAIMCQTSLLDSCLEMVALADTASLPSRRNTITYAFCVPQAGVVVDHLRAQSTAALQCLPPKVMFFPNEEAIQLPQCTYVSLCLRNKRRVPRHRCGVRLGDDKRFGHQKHGCCTSNDCKTESSRGTNLERVWTWFKNSFGHSSTSIVPKDLPHHVISLLPHVSARCCPLAYFHTMMPTDQKRCDSHKHLGC